MSKPAVGWMVDERTNERMNGAPVQTLGHVLTPVVSLNLGLIGNSRPAAARATVRATLNSHQLSQLEWSRLEPS